MYLRNNTNHTISVNVFGEMFDIAPKWSLSVSDLPGKEEELFYIYLKSKKELDLVGYDKDTIKCPFCGEEISLKKKVEKIEKKAKEVKKSVKKTKKNK